MHRPFSKLIHMRCIAVGLFGLFSSLAYAGASDVDAVCGAKPQEKPLKPLCTEPLLSSTRQLERAYWAALANTATPESYQELRKDLQQWRGAYALCGRRMSDQETGNCLTQAVTRFGATLEPRFSESMDDTTETDELFDAAKQTLSSLDQQMANRLSSCRRNAEAQLDTGRSPPLKIAGAIAKNCHGKALDYVELLLSEQDESALYLLKDSRSSSTAIRAETEKRYGANATESFVREARTTRESHR